MAVFPGIENPVYTSGGTPFEFQYENYTEQFNFRMSNSFMKARVAWEDSGDFLADVLGGTVGTIGQSTYDRTLPLAHPMIQNQWCTDAKLLAYPSTDGTNANQPDEIGEGGFTTDWAIYGLTFSTVPYAVLDNTEISGFTIKELGRYCVFSYRPRAREFTVKSFGLQPEGSADDENLLPLPAFIVDREQDIVITQMMVPTELVPYGAIDDCTGRINSADIEVPIPPGQAGGLYTIRTFPAQTLLCRGVATDLTAYPKPQGPGMYTDVPLFFTYRPNGWRKLPKASGDFGFETMVYNRSTPTKYLYDTEAFADMFKPVA